MKRTIFIVLILLLIAVFLYFPNKNLIAQSPSCFLEGNSDLVIDKEEAKFIYDGIYTSKSNFVNENGQVKLKAKYFSDSGEISEKEIDIEEYYLSENCRYYTFEFERVQDELNFVLEFDRIEEGQCVYKTDEIVEALEIFLYGSLIRKVVSYGDLVPLREICDETDVANALPPNCPAQANCKISVPAEDKEIYSFSSMNDGCGNLIVEVGNGGEKIYSDEIGWRSGEFGDKCVSEKERLRSAEIGTGGGTPAGGTRGTGGGCTLASDFYNSIAQNQLPQEETYCEIDTKNSLQSQSKDVEDCACEKIKKPKSQTDCNKGRCDKGIYCKYINYPWPLSDECKCEGCGGNLPKECGEEGTLTKTPKGCCKSTETCCRGEMCCDKNEPVCNLVAGTDDKGFCQPVSCPPPGEPDKTVTCNQGYIDIPQITGPTQKTKILKCCPQGTTCAYHYQDIIVAQTYSAYCVKDKCEVDKGEYQCPKNSGELPLSTNGLLCCPKGTSCEKISDWGLSKYVCSETSCPEGQELCEGIGGENTKDRKCCPKGTCVVHPNGIPDCR